MGDDSIRREVAEALRERFAALDAWFDRPDDERRRVPAEGGWTIDEVLEHVARTNRFLLRTLRRKVGLAERRAVRGVESTRGASDLDRIRIVGERGAFPWTRPDHMVPTGEAVSEDVRAELAAQLAECESLLARLGDDRGRLVTVTMSVADLGKIDLYEWAFFLAEHMRRHLAQLEASDRGAAPE